MNYATQGRHNDSPSLCLQRRVQLFGFVGLIEAANPLRCFVNAMSYLCRFMIVRCAYQA